MKPIMTRCDICEQQFPEGPHRYEGHVLHLYGGAACGTCWDGNHDGWAPHLEPKLAALLKRSRRSEPPRDPVTERLPRD